MTGLRTVPNHPSRQNIYRGNLPAFPRMAVSYTAIRETIRGLRSENDSAYSRYLTRTRA